MIVVVIARDIKHVDFQQPFYAAGSYLRYDDRSSIAKKVHCLVWNGGRGFGRFGQAGDQCAHLSHAELLQLESDGFVSIKRTRAMTRRN